MRTWAVLGCILACGFFAPAASALIQVDRGIAGARLGNSRAEVRAALGKPTKVLGGSNDFGSFVRYRFAGGLTVTFQGRTRVTGVSTSGVGDRTATGVGVGSTVAEVKAGVPGVTCDATSCHTGSFLPGKRVTDFRLSGGKVANVLVGLVID
jgi:hypothetical protein